MTAKHLGSWHSGFISPLARHKTSMGYNTILQYCSHIYGHPRILPTSTTGSHNITHGTQDKRLERFYEPNVHEGLSLPHRPFWVQKITPLKLKLPFAAKNTVLFSKMSAAWNFAHLNSQRFPISALPKYPIGWLICQYFFNTGTGQCFIWTVWELFVSTAFTPKTLKIEDIYD